MPSLYNIETGKMEPVADEDVTKLVAAGRHFFRKGTIVGRDLKGRAVNIPAEEAPSAFREGYTFETQHQRSVREQRREGAESPVLGTLMTLADKGTLGAVPYLAKEFGGETGEELLNQYAGFKDEWPVLHGAATVGSMFLPGGAGGLVAKGGAKLAAKLGGGIAAKAAAGAAEGAVLGGGELVSEHALGNVEITAANALAYLGGGAVFGAGTGAVVGVASKALQKGATAALDKVASAEGANIAQDMTRASASRALGLKKSHLSRIFSKTSKTAKEADEKFDKTMDRIMELVVPEAGEGASEEAAKFAGRLVIESMDNSDQIAKKLGFVAEDAGRRIGGAVDEVEKALAAAGKSSVKVSSKKIAQRIRREIAPELDTSSSADPGVKRFVSQRIRDMTKRKAAWSMQEAREQARGWGEQAYKSGIKQDLDLKDIKRRIERIITDEMEQAMERNAARVGKEQAFQDFKAAKDLYSTIIDVSETSSHEAMNVLGNRMFGLTDNIAGYGTAAAKMAAGDGLAGVTLGGLAMGVVNKQFRERAPSAIARISDKAANLQWLQKASDIISKDISGAVAGFIEGGSKKTATAITAAMATNTLLDGFTSQKKDAKGDVVKLAKLSGQEARELVANPDLLVDRMTAKISNLESHAPQTAAAMAAKAASAVRFLAEKAPKAPSIDPLMPTSDGWQPDTASAMQFARYYRAVLDPMSVVRDLGEGSISMEGAEVLRTLYPEIHEQTAIQLLGQINEKEKTVPYEDRIRLSIFFGLPLHGSMRPGFIQRLQSTYAPTKQSGQGGGGLRLTGLDKVKIAGRMSLDQTLEDT